MYLDQLSIWPALCSPNFFGSRHPYMHSGFGRPVPQYWSCFFKITWGSDGTDSRASPVTRTSSTSGRGPHSDIKTEGKVYPGYYKWSTIRPFGFLMWYLGTSIQITSRPSRKGSIKNNCISGLITKMLATGRGV